MSDSNMKRNHYHYMKMEWALRSISKDPTGERRYFNADQLEGHSPLEHLLENWNNIQKKYRIALKEWHETFESLKKDEEELSQDQLDSFIAEVMRVGGRNEDAISDFQEMR